MDVLFLNIITLFYHVHHVESDGGYVLSKVIPLHCIKCNVIYFVLMLKNFVKFSSVQSPESKVRVQSPESKVRVQSPES